MYLRYTDFDVHHGNGTEELLGGKEGFLFCSIHAVDVYPHTGADHIVREKNVINVGLQGETTAAQFHTSFDEKILPALKSYQPDLLILSAGFDAHKKDPTGTLSLFYLLLVLYALIHYDISYLITTTLLSNHSTYSIYPMSDGSRGTTIGREGLLCDDRKIKGYRQDVQQREDAQRVRGWLSSPFFKEISQGTSFEYDKDITLYSFKPESCFITLARIIE